MLTFERENRIPCGDVLLPVCNSSTSTNITPRSWKRRMKLMKQGSIKWHITPGMCPWPPAYPAPPHKPTPAAQPEALCFPLQNERSETMMPLPPSSAASWGPRRDLEGWKERLFLPPRHTDLKILKKSYENIWKPRRPRAGATKLQRKRKENYPRLYSKTYCIGRKVDLRRKRRHQSF